MTASSKTAIAGVCAIVVVMLAGCGGGKAPGTVLRANDAGSQPPSAHSQALSDVLTELAQSQPPEGVDPGVFFALKEELAKQLNSRGDSRIVSKPPENERNSEVWLAVEGAPSDYTLSWYYRNIGDYSQDGKVGVSDITPLAVHFGESYDTGTEPQCLLAAVDGDGNGVIGITDVTPIAVNFGVTCSGYRVEGSPSALAGYSYIGFVEMNAATGAGRLQMQLPLGNPTRLFYHVIPTDENDQPGIASSPVLIPGDAPVVQSVQPLEGGEGDSVQFTTTVDSAAPVAYSWNFGGGATPDSTGGASPTVTLGAPGDYSANLVASSVYGTDTYEFTLTVLSAAPVISNVTPTSGGEGQSVQFNAQVTGGTGASYAWNFGGGASPNTSTAASPTVTLGAPGEYSASLQVTNAKGTDEYLFTLQVLESYDYLWNYAVYVAGDNSLAEVAFTDIDEMEVIGSTADVAINVETEIYDGYGDFSYPTVERFLVVPDSQDGVFNTSGSPANESFNRIGHDSASVDALTGFLNWSLGNFDAHSNALVLWDHGAGWDNGKSTSGLICDDTSGTMLADYEVAAVMAGTGAYWEYLAMDACIMGSVEVAYEYRDVAHYLMFSQESVPWDGFHYTPVLQALTDNPAIDPYDLGQITVDSYIDYYIEHPDEVSGGVTLGIVDLTKMDALVTALNNFAQLVTTNAETEKDAFNAAAAESQYTGSYLGDVDAIDFMQNYKSETSNLQVQAAIDSVLNALNSFVLYFDCVTDGTDFSRYHGVSLWVPGPSDLQYNQSEYHTTNFCNDTLWYDMLNSVIGYSGELVPADIRAELSWETGADIDLWVDEPDPYETGGYSWNSPYLGYSANGVFSLDSYDSGVSFESWDSNTEVMPGFYTFAAEYSWGDPPDDYANVRLKLYEDDNLTFDQTMYIDEFDPYDEEFGYGWYTYGWLEKGRGKREQRMRVWRDAPNRLLIQVQLTPHPKSKQR
jgi:PKD repeat protein